MHFGEENSFFPFIFWGTHETEATFLDQQILLNFRQKVILKQYMVITAAGKRDFCYRSKYKAVAIWSFVFKLSWVHNINFKKIYTSYITTRNQHTKCSHKCQHANTQVHEQTHSACTLRLAQGALRGRWWTGHGGREDARQTWRRTGCGAQGRWWSRRRSIQKWDRTPHSALYPSTRC